jgi:hypothetical protein
MCLAIEALQPHYAPRPCTTPLIKGGETTHYIGQPRLLPCHLPNC